MAGGGNNQGDAQAPVALEVAVEILGVTVERLVSQQCNCKRNSGREVLQENYVFQCTAEFSVCGCLGRGLSFGASPSVRPLHQPVSH